MCSPIIGMLAVLGGGMVLFGLAMALVLGSGERPTQTATQFRMR